MNSIYTLAYNGVHCTVTVVQHILIGLDYYQVSSLHKIIVTY